jgi:hypothetical protein
MGNTWRRPQGTLVFRPALSGSALPSRTAGTSGVRPCELLRLRYRIKETVRRAPPDQIWPDKEDATLGGGDQLHEIGWRMAVLTT